MNYNISDVPQADELKKVILTVEAVSHGHDSDNKIADYVGFSDRQGRYYRKAAIILGLLKNKENHAELTKCGNEIADLDDEHRMRKIKIAIYKNQFLKEIIDFIESHALGVTRSQLASHLMKIIQGANSTIERRLITIINWLKDSDWIIEEEAELENIFKLNVLEPFEEDFNDENLESIYPASYKEELDIREDKIQVYALMRKLQQEKVIMNPDFQRNQVWKAQQQSRFIESLILNIPLPPLYVSQDTEGKLIMVDGLQRTVALKKYLTDHFELVGLEALPELNGKLFSSLTGELKTRIEDKNLLLYVLRPSVPMVIVYDIFNRINTGGTKLERQEIRNCIYIGKSTVLLKELARNSKFKRAIDNGISPKRMKDREAILRFLAFTIFDYKTDYHGDLDDFLGQAMRRINKMQADEIKNIKHDFLRVMNLTFDFFEERNFRLPTNISRGRINIALMESVCYFFHHSSDEYLKKHKKLIVDNFFEKLLKDNAYIESIRLSTGTEKNVRVRFEKASEFLGGV